MSPKISLFLFCICLLGWAHVAYAASSSLTSFCITSYDSTSTSPVPTTTVSATTTSTRTVTVTSTPRTTFTPAPSTTTKTVTSTIRSTVTLPKTINTYTSTVTDTATTSTTTTSVSTATSVTTSTSTDTDPATATPSPGFAPLASVLSNGGYTVGPSPCASAAKRDQQRPHIRDFGLQVRPRATGKVVLGASGNAISISPAQYPAGVGCTSLYYSKATTTSTVTGSTTSTVTAKPSTIVTTYTTTTTVTSTKVPSGVALTTTHITTTSTSTITAISTTTVVSTTSTTVYQPSSTYYPACDVDNLVTCVNGDQVAQILVDYNLYTISGPTNPQDCCIACSLDNGCGGSAFYPFQSTCYGIIDAGTCDANSSYARFGVAPNGSPITLSNSNCGQFGFNGVVG